jgi:hypothetical protein
MIPRSWTSAVCLFCLVALVAAVTPATGADFVYQTLIPGYYLSRGQHIVVDEAGNAYAVGSFYADEVHLDILVTKIDPDGHVVWTKTIIGEEHDYAEGIALDADGNVLITGFTGSVDFPVTPDALDGTLTGFVDVFITRLAASDGEILYSTLLGGDYTDHAKDLAVAPGGQIWVVGSTGSTDFPTVHAYQDHPSAPLYIYTDAFITELSPAGDEILYSTYFGGFREDTAYRVGIDGDGGIVIAGQTTADDFPLVRPIQTEPNGIFVARLTPDGSSLTFSTYLGGSNSDRLMDMAVDGDGYVYLAGSTLSEDLPTTAGSFQPDFVGEILGCEIPLGPTINCDDGFALKLATDGGGIVYGTYLGGLSVDESHGLAVDTAGRAYVTGQTVSDVFAGSSAPGLLYVLGLTSDGGAVSSMLRRASSRDGGEAVAIGPTGDVYITGAAGILAKYYVARIATGQVTAAEDATPVKPALRLFPNPFNPRVTVRFYLSAPGEMELAVYDAAGHRLTTLRRGTAEAGWHTTTWDGRDAKGRPAPSGVYLLRLVTREGTEQQRGILLR